jgi:hypothetical protein
MTMARYVESIGPADLALASTPSVPVTFKPKILGDAAAQALVDDHSVRGVLPRQDDGLLFSAIQFEEDG